MAVICEPRLPHGVRPGNAESIKLAKQARSRIEPVSQLPSRNRAPACFNARRQ